jgi:MFS family permease
VVTQFQGAFNENGLKNLVVFLILGMAMQKADRDRLVLIVGTLFSLPFILFSMTGGFLADRYSKRTVTIWTKFFEMAVMAWLLPDWAGRTCTLKWRLSFWRARRPRCSVHRNTDCSRNFCRSRCFPGAMACSNSERFWQ